MGVCIYCGKNEANSREDWMPRCLGSFRNNERLVEKLCVECNHSLGRLHDYFCHCSFEGFLRRVTGIKGQTHHKKINPFYRGSAGGKHIEMTARHPELDCQMHLETAEGREEAFPARQVIVLDETGRCYPILILDRMREPDDLREELRARGLERSKFYECYTASAEEQKWLERLCSIFGVRVEWSNIVPYEAPGKQLCKIEGSINDKYFREIAQIAFHYYLKQFSHITGFEKEFQGIRGFILNGGDPSGWVRKVPGSFVEGYRGRTEMHALDVRRDVHSVRARVHFFMAHIPCHWEVYIGRNPDRIRCIPPIVGHQFEYFDEPDEQHHDGVMKPMSVIRKALLLV